MVREISEILKQLGWTDGFRIPVSNAENKKLEDMVEAKMKEKARTVADLEEMDERLDALKQHMANVSYEQEENHKLLSASHRRLESTKHLTILIRGDYDGLQRELRNMKSKSVEVTQQCHKMEAEANFLNEKVSNLKKLMDWNEEELLAWEDLHNHKGEDLSLLQHFIDEDAAHFKELEMKRASLQADVDKQSSLAEEATTEVSMLEQVLDRVAQLYRHAHSDHQALIRQWEHSVQAMYMKDKDINDALNEILAVRAQGRLKMAELLEAKELDSNLKSNNAETQAMTEDTHRKLNILRNEDQRLQTDLHELQNELGVLKRSLSAMGMQLKQQRVQNAQMKRDVIERDEKVQNLQQMNEDRVQKLEEVNKNLWDAGKRFRHMEGLVQEEENLRECFHKDISRLQGIYFRTTQELQSVREKERLQITELQRIDKNKAGTLSQIDKLEKELIKIKNSTYELEFSEQKLRSRISRVLGDTKSFEQEENMKKIQNLEGILKEKQEVLVLLTSQVNRLENDCRQMSNMLTTTAKEVEKLQWKRQDGLLLVEGGKKQLKASKASHHDLMVEHALLRVKVNQVQRALEREGSQVFSLSKQRFELENAMKERQLEISLHKEVMMTKRKTLNEERTQLQLAFNQLQTKRDQLQNRYEIIISITGKDEFGDYISPAMQKLKIAQEKIMLEQEGDILNAKTQKAEKEIAAMENTLKVVNASNDTYRKSLTMIDKDGPEGDELKVLEEKYYHAMMELRLQRENLAKMEAEMKDTSKQILELQEQKEQEAFENKELEMEALLLHKELQEQDLKLHRAESQYKRLVRELRSKSDSTMFAMEEKDINLRELIDQNQTALELLAEIAIRHMETAPIINQYLKEKGINLPQPGHHLKGVVSSTTLSGTSSARSGKSSNTSVSSCTIARRRIFDPSNQAIGSFHGTIQTPTQLMFPLTDESCCVPHSTLTLGSVSDTHSLSETSAGSPLTCFEGMASSTLASPEARSNVGRKSAKDLVEVHPVQSGPAMSASTDASQTSVSYKSRQYISTSGQSKVSDDSKKLSGRQQSDSDLLSAITVEQVQGLKNGGRREGTSSPTGSTVSSQGSSHCSSGFSRKIKRRSGTSSQSSKDGDSSSRPTRI